MIGRQEPTFRYAPPYEDSYGDEVIELAASAGLTLDPWQRSLVTDLFALNPDGSFESREFELTPTRRGPTFGEWFDEWLAFEVAWVLSRQNGKGAGIEASELAWLFLFGDKLIIHSAHLYETSGEHFTRMKALIDNHDDFRRRVRRMRNGRGSEEIELIGGARLKFMTRAGGAGRGFTGSKVVYDEAMYLDATAIAASLPTLATIPDCQVLYTGSAGFRTSTQLGAVRRRAYRGQDPSLIYSEWAAVEPEFDRDGNLIAGDDPAAEATWLKTNPSIGLRRNSITLGYIAKEMAAFGGPRSRSWWRERLGIGDWPADDAAYLVIGEDAWRAAGDAESRIPEGEGIAVAVELDDDGSVGTIAAVASRADGRRHMEIMERHRGAGWIVDRLLEIYGRNEIVVVGVLATSNAASLIDAIARAGLPVHSPTEREYAAACGQVFAAVVNDDAARHMCQGSLSKAVGGADKRTSVEGGWRWVDESRALAAVTVAWWAHERYVVEADYDVLAVY